MNTLNNFDEIMSTSSEIFKIKLSDYGPSWIIFRQSSLTDQMLIKAKRISMLEGLNGKQKISDSREDEYLGIINYALIALMKIRFDDVFEQIDVFNDTSFDFSTFMNQRLIVIKEVKELLEKKNHDYGEAWKDMRITSITDQILVKLYRIRTIEGNDGLLHISENIDSHLSDIINYCIFALIKLKGVVSND